MAEEERWSAARRVAFPTEEDGAMGGISLDLLQIGSGWNITPVDVA